jgi:hypothetical protein
MARIPGSKNLTDEQVVAIIDALVEGRTHADIAAEMGLGYRQSVTVPPGTLMILRPGSRSWTVVWPRRMQSFGHRIGLSVKPCPRPRSRSIGRGLTTSRASIQGSRRREGGYLL